MQTIEQALHRLQSSEFRRSFHLGPEEKAFVRERGMAVVRSHAEDFVRMRLAPAEIPNDGRQTPRRGHPVFIAQHATACCCRGCLQKWYRVPQGSALAPQQQKKIVNLLMASIAREAER